MLAETKSAVTMNIEITSNDAPLIALLTTYYTFNASQCLFMAKIDQLVTFLKRRFGHGQKTK